MQKYLSSDDGCEVGGHHSESHLPTRTIAQHLRVDEWAVVGIITHESPRQ